MEAIQHPESSAALPSVARPAAVSGAAKIAGIFFISGFPALIYQLVWQHELSTLYGVDAKSVTVVVAAFMLGLGLGSLLGGRLSSLRRASPLLLFAAIEASIGLCGLLSLDLFARVGRATLQVSTLGTGVITFALVLLPTLMMGATLPILTAFLVQDTRNVGRAVGLLYFANTVGSAVACFATGGVLLNVLGQRGCIRLAACVNFAAAAGAFLLWWYRRSERVRTTEITAPSVRRDTADSRGQLGLAIVLAGLCGFISLSYELLWYRVHSLVTAGAAWTFSFMLGTYLTGIGLGSLIARRLCASASPMRDLGSLSWFVLLASVCSYCVAPLSASIVTVAPYAAILPLIAVSSALLGAQLPLICHFGLRPILGVGQDFSRVYLANIIGSTVGSLLTGMFLLDVLGLRGTSLLLTLLGCAMAASLVAYARPDSRARLRLVGFAVGAAALTLVVHERLHDRLFERLQLKNELSGDQRFSDVVENRSGIITIADDTVIFGGGIYDGRFNVSPIEDENTITRIYAMSLFHPAPARVFGIGLSGGSWAQVLANHPDVQAVDMAEINPGYSRLIRKHGLVASLLDNPKFHLFIEDGRRMLAREPRQFDVIVSNTTYHWRASASNLLSVEFLELARERLAPGGILMYNSTGSTEVYHTACSTFSHVARVFNFVVASDRPFAIDKPRWRAVLERYVIDGRRVFDPADAVAQRRLSEIVSLADGLELADGAESFMESGASLCPRVAAARVITDDNMGTEWRDALARAFVLGCQDGGSCTP